MFICCYLLDTKDFWFIPSNMYLERSRLVKENNRSILTMDLENERKLLECNKERGLELLRKF